MGIFDYITVPFGYLMQFCCKIFPNYLAALAVFTLLIQLVLGATFGVKQQKNSIKQARLAPKVAAIRKKYAGRTDQATMQKQQAEIMQFYQDNGTSQFGGCLPLLIQLPIIMGLYNVIIYPLRFICGICRFDAEGLKAIVENFKSAGIITGDIGVRREQYEIINYIQNDGAGWRELLGGQEPAVLPQFKLGSFDISAAPNSNYASLLILVPILIFITMVASQLITRRFTYQDPMMKEQQNGMSMKIMTYAMPLLSVWISLSMPAAVGIYWIYRSIASTLQQIVLAKLMPPPHFTAEDYKAAERELSASSKKKKKSSDDTPHIPSGKRSLHHIDDEEDEDGSTAEAGEDTPEMLADPSDAPPIKDDRSKKKYKKKGENNG